MPLLLLIYPPKKWGESEILKHLQSNIASNDNIENHHKEDDIWIWYEEVLKGCVLEYEIDDSGDDHVL